MWASGSKTEAAEAKQTERAEADGQTSVGADRAREGGEIDVGA